MKTKYIALTLIFFFLSGCAQKRELTKSELDDLYRVAPPVWEKAAARPLEVGRRTLPHRWELRFEPSTIWSVISLHDAQRKLNAETGKIEFDISLKHARVVGRASRELASKLKSLSKSASKTNFAGSETRWARRTAEILVAFHKLFTSINPERSKREDLDIEDSAAWLVIPLLETAYAVLVETEVAETFAEDTEKFEQAEKTFYLAALKTAFGLIGAETPEGLEGEIFDVLWDKKSKGRKERLVADALLEARRALPVEKGRKTLGSKTGKVAALASMVLDAASQLCFQWNKIDLVALDIRSLDNHKIVGIEINIKPGKKVVLKLPHIASPAITIQGKNRIIAQPDLNDTGRTEVVFASEEGGGVEIGFKGLVYFLSRIFFIPFDDARLKEIRVISGAQIPDTMKSTVMILMRATRKEDGRRIIKVEISKRPLFKERPELPPIYAGDERTILFQYYNEKKVYSTESRSFKPAKLR